MFLPAIIDKFIVSGLQESLSPIRLKPALARSASKRRDNLVAGSKEFLKAEDIVENSAVSNFYIMTASMQFFLSASRFYGKCDSDIWKKQNVVISAVKTKLAVKHDLNRCSQFVFRNNDAIGAALFGVTDST